jgi:hypothetical protein
VIYLLPLDPSSPPVSLSDLCQRAKDLGYRIAREPYSGTFSLLDARTGLPLTGLDRVGLPAIASTIDAVRTKAKS